MNVVFVSSLLLVSPMVFGFSYPSAKFKFLIKLLPSSVYLGETLRIPFEMTFPNLQGRTIWKIPQGTSLEKISGYCPSFPVADGDFWVGACYMNLLISGTVLGQINSGAVKIEVIGKKKGYDWDYTFGTNSFSIKTLPNCPSFNKTTTQYATANQKFNLNLKNWIKNYDENIKAKSPITLTLSPQQQNGLSYDSKNLSLIGKSSHIGNYKFNLTMQNAACGTQTLPIQITVKPNLTEQPVFQKQSSLMTAFPKQKYSMNLMNLLVAQPGFSISNQVQFRMLPDKTNAEWLEVVDTSKLEGRVPDYSESINRHVTLVASSNTGGDSQPITLDIPIAYDPLKKPEIHPFYIKKAAGAQLNFDVAEYIENVENEPVKLYIDKITSLETENIESLPTWLSLNGTLLKGIIPPDAFGQAYHLTLRASTARGGSSEPITIALDIQINPNKKPQFNSRFFLPVAIPGQPYLYDFKEHNSVFPEDLPYEVELAADYPNPGWVKIKNNQLIINEVQELYESSVPLYLIIKNVPGGASDVIKVPFQILTSKDIVLIGAEE